jgi:7-cyano-7-deazaguanine synthase
MEQVIGERREVTFVPMRNALFLTIAANRAEVLGITDIITGVCQMDNANYDDCREVFIRATEQYINTALGHDHRGTPAIRIVTPLLHATKEQTVHIAFANPACWQALAYSHTSYDGKYPPTDMNHANVLRADGFAKAGRPDPLVVRAWKEGLMELPLTENYSQKSMIEAGFVWGAIT